MAFDFVSMASYAIVVCAVPILATSSAFEFRFDLHICAVCDEMARGFTCERFNACHAVHNRTFEEICTTHCPLTYASPHESSRAKQLGSQTGELDIRVTKGFGSKNYDLVRISVVTRDSKVPIPNFFDYSSQFKYKWTSNYLHSALKQAKPGTSTAFDVGTLINVTLPVQGRGVAGVLIADPCMQGGSITGLVGCMYGEKYHTYNRTVELINTFVSDGSTDFWGIFGDNFYDRYGDLTVDVFSRISMQAKSKLFLSVVGNHDYWILDPLVSTTADQCGNGYMQFYAQDTKASEFNFAGNSSAPFDFSVDPDKDRILGLGCNTAAKDNFFWYNQIGNVGLIGQSGAYSYDDVKPFMSEACSWASQQHSLDVLVLVGHWDKPGMGAESDMAMPQWYTEMADLPGCQEFQERSMLKFVMGHTHCNDPHPHGKVGAGFRVAGFGMEGCGNYGMPLVDTTENRVRFWYFDTSSDDRFKVVIDCVKSRGWRQCTHLATLWLDQAIQKSSSDSRVVVL